MCVPIRPEVGPYLTKVVGLAVVVGLQYGVPVYLPGLPRLAMAFKEDWMLTKMFGDKAED